MRNAHLLFLPVVGAPELLAYGAERELKEQAKQLAREGLPNGPGILEFWLAPSALGEPAYFKFKVPAAVTTAPAPVVKQTPRKKLFA